jgi:hypothetical protein
MLVVRARHTAKGDGRIDSWCSAPYFLRHQISEQLYYKWWLLVESSHTFWVAVEELDSICFNLY